MSLSQPGIRIQVDVTNPGQFFACCGLLELADRLWPGAEGWFEDREFRISANDGTLTCLLSEVAKAPLQPLDSQDLLASPLALGRPFDLQLDWWKDEHGIGSELKTWAGTMNGFRIARSMQAVLADPSLHTLALLDQSLVVYDPDDSRKKVEPFYFDARRGANAQALDIGFMPDTFQMTTSAFPAVEFLCLVGLQRARPRPTGTSRVFDYFTWTQPFPPALVPAACCGLLPLARGAGYRFENAFRTTQKKHKSFLPAVPSGGEL